VRRGFGESPLVTNDEGNPVEINIGKDIVFGVADRQKKRGSARRPYPAHRSR